MSESRHTPGPWKLSNDAQGPCIVMHPTLEGVAIASLTNIHEPVNGFVEIEAAGAPERTANARLIAAALELLEACEGMRNIAEDILANDDPDGTDGRAAQALLDAIAKARGTASDDADDLCDLRSDPPPDNEPEPPNNRVPGGGWRTV